MGNLKSKLKGRITDEFKLLDKADRYVSKLASQGSSLESKSKTLQKIVRQAEKDFFSANDTAAVKRIETRVLATLTSLQKDGTRMKDELSDMQTTLRQDQDIYNEVADPFNKVSSALVVFQRKAIQMKESIRDLSADQSELLKRLMDSSTDEAERQRVGKLAQRVGTIAGLVGAMVTIGGMIARKMF